MQTSTAAVVICPLCLVLFEFRGHFPIPGSAEASLPLEKEEQVRLQARKRLEEQLKQYRVKRQQERVSPALGQANGELLCSRRGQSDVMLGSWFTSLCFSGKAIFLIGSALQGFSSGALVPTLSGSSSLETSAFHP